jgi:hypothetical protein
VTAANGLQPEGLPSTELVNKPRRVAAQSLELPYSATPGNRGDAFYNPIRGCLEIGHFEGFGPPGGGQCLESYSTTAPALRQEGNAIVGGYSRQKTLPLLPEGVSTSTRTYKHSTPAGCNHQRSWWLSHSKLVG